MEHHGVPRLKDRLLPLFAVEERPAAPDLLYLERRPGRAHEQLTPGDAVALKKFVACAQRGAWGANLRSSGQSAEGTTRFDVRGFDRRAEWGEMCCTKTRRPVQVRPSPRS
jgi:hypothetical protein